MATTARYRPVNSQAAAPNYSEGSLDTGFPPRRRNVKYTGLLVGIALAALVFSVAPADLSHEARATAAVTVLMGTWWLSEAIPLAATALLPLTLFPMMGVIDLGDVSGVYANETIFLLLGGFLLALSMQRWNLHKRIALHIVLLTGTKTTHLIGGFMVATAGIGMWVSNTATAMMMIPMGMSVVALIEEQGGFPKKTKFGVGLIISIAYAASISAFGTLIASPVNVIVAGYIRENLGYNITFLEWMTFGLPAMIVFLFLGWIILAKWLWRPEVKELPGGKELFRKQLSNLGPTSVGEWLVGIVFLCTALLWICVPLIFTDPWADNGTIAMIGATVLFLIPAKLGSGVMLMNWEAAKEVPWDVLILVGGGLALSSQITDTGLAEWIGGSLSGLAGLPQWVFIIVLILLLLALSEFTSTVATAAAFVPIVSGVAVGVGQDPVLYALAAGLACLCAFMIPIATPPNAMAFASGSVTLPQMMRSGIWMNLTGAVVVTSTVLFLVPAVLGR